MAPCVEMTTGKEASVSTVDLPSDISRRHFLVRTFTAMAMAGVPEWYIREAVAAERARIAEEPRRIGPNDQINVGLIGAGGSRGGFRQGLGVTRWAASKPGVRVVAVCDVDGKHLEEAAAAFNPTPAKYRDFRELIARKDIDAVIIGTPDHWHAVIAIAAMKAGKDVYCEKPLTLFVEEGRRMVRVARETRRILQTGSQQRSDGRFRLACELVRNGRIGKIKRVVTHLPGGPVDGPFPVQPVPPDFDWDLWLGPAPWTEYVPQRTHGTFRHWLEYSGGMITDWGAHHNDIAQWALGMDESGPRTVQAYGRGPRIGKDCYNTFPEFSITYTYPDNITMICTNEGENGVDFEGENGSIFVSRSTIRASDPRILEEPLPASATRLYVSNDHMQNFLDCMRSRKLPICDVEIGHRSVTVCHLANISLRLGGRRLEWDPVAEKFKNDREANALLTRPMRKPWHL
ncbi:MAG: Gfo/Idh/MocA family oxidoreductase [Chloroherpetonaceae bacterium]|nr:Gfo/Idh/MocA family oxidoreductase [Chloroherpetonaceae bacterium]